MDNDSCYFLPSEIARLVLGYLENEGCTMTCKAFMKESVHLQEYVALLRRGRQHPLTIHGFSLLEMLEKFAQLYLIDASKQTVGISALWSQLESVLSCLKRHTACKNLRIEGFSQNSRTRRGNVRARYEVDERGDASNRHSNSRRTSLAKSVDPSPYKNETNSQNDVDKTRIPVNVAHNSKHCVNLDTRNLPTSTQKIAPKTGAHCPPREIMKSQIIVITSPAKTHVSSHSVLENNSNTCNSNSNFQDVNIDTLECPVDPVQKDLLEIEASLNVKSSQNIPLCSNSPEKVEKDAHKDLSGNEEVNSGAGFHDSAMDCDNNTQLSPLTTPLWNDDVKDSSGEGAKLALSESAKVENSLICDKLNRDNSESSNIKSHESRENLITSDVCNVDNVECSVLNRCETSSQKVLESHKSEAHQPEGMEVCLPQPECMQEGHTSQTQMPNEHCSEAPAVLMPCSSTVENIPKATSEVAADGPKQDVPLVPLTPKKVIPTTDLPLSKTPVKNLREFGFHGQGKSPRRKRPPKRKSHADGVRERRLSVKDGQQNESSNSNDGSVHDSSFPTQFLEQLLNNPLLHEKLAENINKTINCSDLSKSQNLSDTSLMQDTSHKSVDPAHRPSFSLEDILDPHETQMTEQQINSIIDMTKGDNVFDSLFNLFNQDSGLENTYKIYKGEITSSDAISSTIGNIGNSTALVLHESHPLSLNIESTTTFKPINSAEIMSQDSLLSFPSVIPTSKVYENKYVSENSINAVLNPYPVTRTLNTPTDFSMISLGKLPSESTSNVNTSTSSSIMPTVTISTASNSIPVYSPHVTVTCQTESLVSSVQSTSSQLFQASSLPGTVISSASSQCLPSTTVVNSESSKSLILTTLPHVSENDHIAVSVQPGTSLNLSTTFLTPVTTGQGKTLKAASYVSFVKGASDNSSTPVGDRASPLAVQFEDNSKTFHELPSEVKNLFSSFEQSLSDMSKSKEEIELDQNKNSKSKKSKKTSPKQKKLTPEARKTPKSKGQNKKSKEKHQEDSSHKELKSNEKNIEERNKNSPLLKETAKTPKSSRTSDKNKKSATATPDAAGSSKKSPTSSSRNEKSSKTDTEIKSSKKKVKASPPSKSNSTPPNPKEKHSTPKTRKPLVRCDPLQPKNDNKTNKVASKTSSSKWSSGLSALIKIASPEKQKKEPVQTGTSEEAINNVQPVDTVYPGTSKETQNIAQSSVFKDSPQVQAVAKVNTRVPETTTGTPHLTSKTVEPVKEPQTDLHRINTSSKDGLTNQNQGRELGSPKTIMMGPSCLGDIVKINDQTGQSSVEKLQPTFKEPISQVVVDGNTTDTRNIILSMPILDGNSGQSITAIQIPNSMFLAPQPHVENTQVCNNETPIIANSHIQPSSASSIAPFSNFSDTLYTESIDFLESPRKNAPKVNSNFVFCTNVEEPTSSQIIYTATPLTNYIGSQQIHIRTLDVEIQPDSSSPQVPQKPKTQTKRNKVQLIKPSKARQVRSAGQQLVNSAKNRKSVLEVLNSDSRGETETPTNSPWKTQENLNIGNVDTPSFKTHVQTSTETIGLSSIIDSGRTRRVVAVQKDKSIYRPLSETESEDDSRSVTSVKSIHNSQIIESTPLTFSPMFPPNDDDFIPDAAGVVHMKNGQAKSVGSQLSNVIKIPTQSQHVYQKETSNEGPVEILNQKPAQTKQLVKISAQNQRIRNTIQSQKEDIFDPAIQRCIVSPSCKKLIGQLGYVPQPDKHLGQPLNTHIDLGCRRNDKTTIRPISKDITVSTAGASIGTVSNIKSVVPMPMVYDIHLTRESSNDTCSSELEHIMTSSSKIAKKTFSSEDIRTVSKDGVKSNVHLYENNANSPFSTDSEDIDVVGDWENPWTSSNSILSEGSNDVTLTDKTHDNHVTGQQGNHVTFKEINSLTFKSSHVPGKNLQNMPSTSNDSNDYSSAVPNQKSQQSSRFLMTPPKKRVTASLKCGSGLYFVSTSDSENRNENPEKVNKSKRTPRKTISEESILRRSPRVKLASERSGTPTKLMDNVKRNLTDICGNQTCKQDVKSGTKRQREESEDDSKSTDNRPRAKKKLEFNATLSSISALWGRSVLVVEEAGENHDLEQCKTPVDLTKLNVDKFLTKLYKK